MSVQKIVIVGNIGTAKSTDIKYVFENFPSLRLQYPEKLSNITRVLIYLEPLLEVKPFLDNYYELLYSTDLKKKRKAAFEIQNAYLNFFSRISKEIQQLERQAEESGENILLLIERSPNDVFLIFTDILEEVLGKKYYRELHQRYHKEMTINNVWTDNIQYIRFTCSMKTMYQRIHDRKIDSEASDKMITPEYLQILENKYNQKKFYSFTIDTEQNEQKHVIKLLLNFLK